MARRPAILRETEDFYLLLVGGGTTVDNFRVSVRVVDASEVAIANATVTLSPLGLTATPGSDGFYSFAAVPRGSSFTVSVSRPGYTFSPNQTFNNLNAHTVARFTGTVLLRSISGIVTSTSGQVVSGVKISILKNSTTVLPSVVTGPSGQYNVPGLPADAVYTVNPSKLNSSFTPASRNVSLLQANEVANFGISTSFVIKGRVTDALNNRIAGAAVEFRNSALGILLATSTSASGLYASPPLPPGTYVVHPSKPNFLFTDASVPIVNADVSRDFIGSKPFISVSGRVTNASGGRFAGMKMILTGGINMTNSTASDGSFVFNNLQGNLNYTLTPSRSNFVFSPASFTFTSLDRTQSFHATPLLPLTGRIAARVRERVSIMPSSDFIMGKG